MHSANYKWMENLSEESIENILENLNILIGVWKWNQDDDSGNNDQDFEENNGKIITINMKISDELMIHSSIWNLVQKILNFKWEIIKWLILELESTNPLENIELSNSMFFSYLIAYLKSQDSINEDDINQLEKNYNEFIVDKNKDIFKKKVENEISNLQSKKINPVDLLIIENSIKSPIHSKIILNYLGNYPKNSTFIISLIEEIWIEETCIFIKNINWEKLNQLLINTINIKQIAELINNVNNSMNISQLIEETNSDILNEIFKWPIVTLKLSKLIKSKIKISTISAFLNEVSNPSFYLLNINENQLLELLINDVYQEKLFQLLNSKDDCSPLAKTLNKVPIIKFLNLTQEIDKLNRLVHFIYYTDSEIVATIIKGLNNDLIKPLLDSIKDMMAFSDKLNKLDDIQKFNSFIKLVNLEILAEVNNIWNIIHMLDTSINVAKLADFINRIDNTTLEIMLSEPPLYDKYTSLIENISINDLEKVLIDINLDEFLRYLGFNDWEKYIIAFVNNSKNIWTSIDLFNTMISGEFYMLLKEISDYKKLNEFLLHDRAIKFISQIDYGVRCAAIINEVDINKFWNLIVSVWTLRTYSFLIELINELSHMITLSSKINEVSIDNLTKLLKKWKQNSVKTEFMIFLETARATELNDVVRETPIDRIIKRIEKYWWTKVAKLVNNESRVSLW
jgi:hypothetical protein